MKRSQTLAPILLLAFCHASLPAQNTPEPATGKVQQSPAPASSTPYHLSEIDTQPIQTFYLPNLSQPNDAYDIVSTVRNLLPPAVKVYLVSGQNALMVRASPADLLLVGKILNDLDRPRKSYRLTYTLTEFDGTSRIGAQRFSMIVVAGGHTVLKNGSRVPIVTGSYKPENAAAESQVTYLDIGINLDASLDEFNNGARLRTKVEQSSVAPEASGVGKEDPVVRQSLMEGTAFLTVGKPVLLGALDITGSTRHLDVEVVMEPVR